MMTSSNGNIFCITGPFCEEFTGPRWIPLTKASDAELWYFLWSVPGINGWVNNREAGDLRHQRAHYDVIVMGKNSHKGHPGRILQDPKAMGSLMWLGHLASLSAWQLWSRLPKFWANTKILFIILTTLRSRLVSVWSDVTRSCHWHSLLSWLTLTMAAAFPAPI